MGRRLVIVLVVAAALVAVRAPAAFADIAVTNMSPAFGVGGTSVTCTVEGTFYADPNQALAPAFALAAAGKTVTGTTNSYTATSASVTFVLPASGPAGTYDLQASQVLRRVLSGVDPFIYRASLTSAFDLYLRPVISSLSPTSVVVSGVDHMLVVNGSGFVTSTSAFGSRSTVRYNGESLATTFDSSGQLKAVIPAAKLATAGTAKITVFTNGSGVLSVFPGVLSNAATFTVVLPTPRINAIDPASAVAGGPAFSLGVSGGDFVLSGANAAVVLWNGTPLATTRNSPDHLTALVPAGLIAAPGINVSIMVRNGPPLSPFSNSKSFTITVATPAITTIDPISAVAGGPGFNLVVNGTDFLTGAGGAVVLWNTTALGTTRDSSTHLTAAVPAGLIASAGTATISVRNGAGGAPVSSPKSFTISDPVPTVTSISPTSVWAGSVKPGMVLTVIGGNFVNGSRITLDGSDRSGTTFKSSTQLNLPLAATDIATAGTVNVGVANPPFRGGAASATTVPLSVQAETSTPAVTISGAEPGGWYNIAVALTFAASDSQSGVQKVQYMAPPAVAAWTNGSAYTVPVTTQGSVTVSAQALDWCNQAGSVSLTVGIDTTAPGTKTLGNVAAKKGKTARLGFRVTEPAGLSPTATARIDIRKSNGKVVKSFPVANVPVNSDRSQSFTCNFAKGAYRWYVYATDLAGNTQANVANAKLTVK